MNLSELFGIGGAWARHSFPNDAAQERTTVVPDGPIMPADLTVNDAESNVAEPAGVQTVNLANISRAQLSADQTATSLLMFKSSLQQPSDTKDTLKPSI